MKHLKKAKEMFFIDGILVEEGDDVIVLDPAESENIVDQKVVLVWNENSEPSQVMMSNDEVERLCE